MSTAKFRFIRDAKLSPLTGFKRRIEFQFKALVNWENRALLAILEPADPVSAENLSVMEVERTRLSERCLEVFKIDLRNIYMPHTTLGYFANKDDADRCNDNIIEWNDRLRSKTTAATICFDSMSLYGFTDMVTFVREEKG